MWYNIIMDNRGANNPNWKGGLVPRICQICGKGFKVKAKVVRNGYGNYCSRICVNACNGKKIAQAAFKKRVLKYCIVCKKEIRVKPSHAKIEGTYCSKDCMSIDYRSRMAQDRNPNYRHGEAGTIAYERKMAKKWRDNNKDKIRVTNRNTKARRNKAKGKHTKADIDFLHLFQKKKCIVCQVSLTKKYHVDHIQPIALGGSNYKTNLQLLCPPCNLNKKAQDPIVFMQSKGFLL